MFSTPRANRAPTPRILGSYPEHLDARLTVVRTENASDAVVDDPEGSPPAFGESWPTGIDGARAALPKKRDTA